MIFKIYKDIAGEWRWRLRSRNGNVVADSGEGYKSKSNAKQAVKRLYALGKNHELRIKE